jgi:hypothetical protein
MQSVPDKIEGGDLIGEELHRKQRCAGADNPPAGEHVKPFRKGEHFRMRQKPQCGHGSVDVESRGKRYSDNQCNQFLAVEGQFHLASIGSARVFMKLTH